MKYPYVLLKSGLLVFFGLCLTACDRFLDVTPKGFTLLKTVTDYDQWLNNASLATDYEASLINRVDLVDLSTLPDPPTSSNDLIYSWAVQSSSGSSPWGDHYSNINYYNSVVLGVDAATGGTVEERNSLKAEALLGRALEYYNLVNEYGQPYDAATATTDPGVPLVTSDDVAQTIPARSSVQEVYDFIINDLQEAIASLPVSNAENRFRGSVAAGHSVLARVYLSMRDYVKAGEQAKLALDKARYAQMIDYNALDSYVDFQHLSVRQDALYARIASSGATPSLEHLRSFHIRDKRLALFYYPLQGQQFTQRTLTKYYAGGAQLSTVNGNGGTSVQEMKLIVAEAAARNNELDDALRELDEVRKYRIPSESYEVYSSDDQEAVLQEILEERKLELPYLGGIRWFDMRRLAKEGRMPEVVRYDEEGNAIATLPPGSPRYTLRIPEIVFQYNPDMKQNP